MIAFLLFSFFVDYASFPYRGRIYRTELYYQIPYNEITYQAQGDSLISHYLVIFNIRSQDLQHTDTISKTAVLRSYKAAKARDISMIDQHGIFLMPGEYDYRVTLSCSSKIRTVKGKISLPEIEKEYILLSDLELAVAAYPDTTPTSFTKFGLTVVPNPSRIFGGRWQAIYPYFEIYNLKPDSNSYTVNYSIMDAKEKVVRKTKERSQKVFTAQNEVIGINISGLKEGSYTLEVAIDDSSTGQKAEQRRVFKIAATSKVIATTDRYDELIRILLGKVEFQRYSKLPPARKQVYIEQFKKSELYQRYQRRVDYANEHFKIGKRSGWKTDRGRIYIKYGPPDETINKSFEEKIKPIQHWVYYNQGLHFIFMDFSGDGDYLLLWSNSKKETNYPNWERYLPQQTIEEY